MAEHYQQSRAGCLRSATAMARDRQSTERWIAILLRYHDRIRWLQQSLDGRGSWCMGDAGTDLRQFNGVDREYGRHRTTCYQPDHLAGWRFATRRRLGQGFFPCQKPGRLSVNL